MKYHDNIAIEQLLNNEENFISKRALSLMVSIVIIIAVGMYLIDVPIYDNMTLIINKDGRINNAFSVNSTSLKDIVEGDTVRFVQDNGKNISLMCTVRKNSVYFFKPIDNYVHEGKPEIPGKIYLGKEHLITSILKSIIQK